MNKPKTEYALVREARTDKDGNKIEIVIHIVKSEKFDFTDYSFLRMSPTSKLGLEEWVPTKELDYYKPMKE